HNLTLRPIMSCNSAIHCPSRLDSGSVGPAAVVRWSPDPAHGPTEGLPRFPRMVGIGRGFPRDPSISFPRVCGRGKVLEPKSQSYVRHDLKLGEYFANPVAKL